MGWTKISGGLDNFRIMDLCGVSDRAGIIGSQVRATIWVHMLHLVHVGDGRKYSATSFGLAKASSLLVESLGQIELGS